MNAPDVRRTAFILIELTQLRSAHSEIARLTHFQSHPSTVFLNSVADFEEASCYGVISLLNPNQAPFGRQRVSRNMQR